MRVVIPSLDYADFLAVVLPAWRTMLPREVMTVVTAPADQATRDVAERNGIACWVTDAWRKDGAILNKARALDEAFGLLPGYRESPTEGEVCLALDADVFPFGRFPTASELAADTLYGCARHYCPTAAVLHAHLLGKIRRHQLQLMTPKLRKVPGVILEPSSPDATARLAAECLGYFQLFRWKPGVAFGDSRTAGKYDLEFRNHFAHRVPLTAFYVLHLGMQDRRNWQGRTLPQWKEA